VTRSNRASGQTLALSLRPICRGLRFTPDDPGHASSAWPTPLRFEHGWAQVTTCRPGRLAGPVMAIAPGARPGWHRRHAAARYSSRADAAQDDGRVLARPPPGQSPLGGGRSRSAVGV